MSNPRHGTRGRWAVPASVRRRRPGPRYPLRSRVSQSSPAGPFRGRHAGRRARRRWSPPPQWPSRRPRRSRRRGRSCSASPAPPASALAQWPIPPAREASDPRSVPVAGRSRWPGRKAEPAFVEGWARWGHRSNPHLRQTGLGRALMSPPGARAKTMPPIGGTMFSSVHPGLGTPHHDNAHKRPPANQREKVNGHGLPRSETTERPLGSRARRAAPGAVPV